MKNRITPFVDIDDLYLGRPVARGGISPRGSAISWIIVLLAFLALAGFTYDTWHTLFETPSEASKLQQGMWIFALAVQWLALFAAGFYLTLAAGMCYETGRVPGLSSRRARRLMLTLTVGSWSGPTVLAAWRRSLYVGLVAAALSWWLFSVRPLAVVVMSVSFLIWSIVRTTTPPVAVFLGTSDHADLEWHWTLLHLARPLRVVSCLDVNSAETLWKSRDLTFDCFRSPAEESWWETVQALLRLTPLVLIDGTVVTPALMSEARSLLDSGQAFKCIVLCGPSGERDLLEAVGVPKGLLCTISADAILPLVTDLLARGDLPNPGRPVSHIASGIGPLGPWLEKPVPAHVPPEKPLAVHENVAFTVFKPKVVAPLKWYPLLAFAHLEYLPEEERRLDEPSMRAQVQAQASALLGERLSNYTDSSEDASQAIPSEAEITFVPFIPGFRFNPPEARFLFLEAIHKEELRLQAPADLDGQVARGRLSVYWGRILLAELNLAVRVDSRFRDMSLRESGTEGTAVRPYRRVFASYSHDDTSIVMEFERYARALGDRYLIDRDGLRSGEVWDERLRGMIREADAFQLFWSRNALYSPFVEKEWRYALSLGRDSFVRPVYWEEPLPALPEKDLPPQELLRLHFHRFQSVPAKPQPPEGAIGRATMLPEIDRGREDERDIMVGEMAKSRKSTGLWATLGLLVALLPAVGGGLIWWSSRMVEAEKAALAAELAQQKAAIERERNVWAKIEKNVGPGVVRIECRYRLRHPSTLKAELGGHVEGSGVQIRPGLILTALHVVEPWQFALERWDKLARQVNFKPEYDLLDVRFPGQQPLKATLVASSQDHGLALLAVPSTTAPVVPMGKSNASIEVTDRIAALGYSGGLEQYLVPAENASGTGDEIRNIVEVMPTFVVGTVIQPPTGTGGTYHPLFFDAFIWPSTGGGPVLNQLGEIIGIVIFRFDRPGPSIEILGRTMDTRLPSLDDSQAVSPDEIQAFLRQHGIY